MLKVNEFETATYEYKQDKMRFSIDANAQYSYPSVEELIANPDAISAMVKHHLTVQVPRLKELEEYFKGNNKTIFRRTRRKEEYMADHRAAHNFSKYITTFIQGYMVGVPLKTVHKDKIINDRLQALNRTNEADEHNSQMVMQISMYGRAYELLYRKENNDTRFAISNVKDTFVIYDDTVEHNRIAAVRHVSSVIDPDKHKIYLYTDAEIYTYELNINSNYVLKEIDLDEHFFGGVPIIEYENNEFRQGDYEDVLSLIDLYDSSQSDLANYSQDLNDATLVIKGRVNMDTAMAREMKKMNILLLKPATAPNGGSEALAADYIYKKYDVAGMEAYKTRILNDIFLISNVPNLLDESFSGNQSGEAIKQKLFGLAQKRAIKERLFKKSLRDRYRLISNIAETASEGSFEVNDIQIIFTENLPRSISQEVEWFTKLGGELSKETTMALLPIVENGKEELERLAKEKEAEKETEPTLQDFQKYTEGVNVNGRAIRTTEE